MADWLWTTVVGALIGVAAAVVALRPLDKFPRKDLPYRVARKRGRKRY